MNIAISHELLAPLSATAQLTQQLLKTKLSSTQKRMVKTMLAASRLVLFFSNDLIDQNMIEHGHISSHMETCSPEQAILEILDVVRGDCQSRKLVINLKLEEIQGIVL